MTDIVEQAARKVFEHQIPLASDKPRDFDDPKFLYERNKAFDTAQALADAGLLAQPARTMPTREEIVETVSDIDAKSWPNPASTEEIADAVLELLAGQRTDLELESAQQRLYAWEQIARHPFFEECFDTEGTLIDAMLGRLDVYTKRSEQV